MKTLPLILIFLFSIFAAPVLAQTKDVNEIRARDIGHQLRCVVCQNESIEESNAELAVDMREIVRDRIAAGDSDFEVVEYMRARYGDYVLLKPPVQSNTYVLWFMPVALVIAFLVWFALRAKEPETVKSEADLSDEDNALLGRLMEDET